LEAEEINSFEGRKRFISPLGAVALAFGYAVGWGAFIMPGTTFLPGAGPLGTLIGVLLGTAAMVIFAINYHRLTLRYPGPGGASCFAQKVFGEDHGFLVAWFLWLTYIAILWANATALILIVRFTLGDILQFGFHYSIAGFDVYLGEALLSITAILVCGGICLCGRKLAVITQTVFASILAIGVFFFFFFALSQHKGGLAAMAPAFMNGISPVMQISRILALMPWAFVGFEAITHSSAEFRFPLKKTAAVLIASIILSAAVYIFLALLPVITLDAGHGSWIEYIKGLGGSGIRSVPVFASAEHLLGNAGVALMSTLMIAGQLTGIIASLVAVSRLMHAMSEADILPKRLGALNADGTPQNAMLFIITISCAIPFFGRTAIGWPVDVSSIGAALAYGYTSAAAFQTRGGFGKHQRFWIKAAGLTGMIFALFFFLMLVIPNYISGTVMASPSYLLLAVWCILGFLFYRKIFKEGHKQRFGRSPVVWNFLAVTIIFASLMWVRQTSFENAKSALYECVRATAGNDTTINELIGEKIGSLNVTMLCDAAVEMTMLLISMGILYSLASILRKRELELVSEKSRIEEINRAKSYFFSTVSHDIRTPLNAIIGFSQLLKEGFKTQEEHDQAVDSILMSSKTLLKLINDVLDLSKLEASRMVIDPEPTDCDVLIREIVESFRIASKKPELDIRAKIGDMPILLLDPQRMRQIVFNLLGNAVKFTQEGFVEVRAEFAPNPGEEFSGCFRLDVEDSGCGISEEDIQRIATPYVQVGSNASSRHGGTGLGLAITRELANAMNGKMTVSSTLGKGTTFHIMLQNVRVGHLPEKKDQPEDLQTSAASQSRKNKTVRLLLVDDQKLNLIVLKAMLAKIGQFDISLADNGLEAMRLLEDPDIPPFDMVLTDMWMPEMDGAALVQAVRKHPELAPIPVYVITADIETTKDYSELGFSGILLKPVTLESLQETLKSAGFC
jgi:signal transduction histidine kinase/CheY-like chemotaxis protein